MNSSLILGRGGATLELEFTAVHHGPEDGEAAGTDVLTAVLESSVSFNDKTVLLNVNK